MKLRMGNDSIILRIEFFPYRPRIRHRVKEQIILNNEVKFFIDSFGKTLRMEIKWLKNYIKSRVMVNPTYKKPKKTILFIPIDMGISSFSDEIETVVVSIEEFLKTDEIDYVDKYSNIKEIQARYLPTFIEKIRALAIIFVKERNYNDIHLDSDAIAIPIEFLTVKNGGRVQLSSNPKKSKIDETLILKISFNFFYIRRNEFLEVINYIEKYKNEKAKAKLMARIKQHLPKKTPSKTFIKLRMDLLKIISQLRKEGRIRIANRYIEVYYDKELKMAITKSGKRYILCYIDSSRDIDVLEFTSYKELIKTVKSILEEEDMKEEKMKEIIKEKYQKIVKKAYSILKKLDSL